MTHVDSDLQTSPFHSGEITLQKTLGVEARMDAFGRRVIRDYMPAQHREFFAQLPFVAAGRVDEQGDVWATLLAGQPGFISSPDPRVLRLNLTSDQHDPALHGIKAGDAIGLLGIELHTRRRNRMNGVITHAHGNALSIAVEHSFGNCPQYIQARDAKTASADNISPSSMQLLPALDDEALGTIRTADTFFAATWVDLAAGHRQVDVSHRGGKSGFVRIDEAGTLVIPDFSGNKHFNTLGNIVSNPRAGLTFVDFETGDLLQMSGSAQVVLDAPDLAAFAGAERLWTFTPERIVRRRHALPLRFEFVSWSPKTLLTGDWSQVSR